MAAERLTAMHDKPRHRLFCYGTLQLPTVLEAVIGRRLQGCRAFLVDHGAFRVHQAEYPGLRRSPGRQTWGILYGDVTGGELDVLDRFEGPLYRRQPQVVSKCGGQRVRAWVYKVAPGRNPRVSSTPWHLHRFMRGGYRRFMKRFVIDRRTFYERASE
jgi:gamma-glutamylcyclotransferase (GGCT)/AIG2-like uncharacterized protein YtfP